MTGRSRVQRIVAALRRPPLGVLALGAGLGFLGVGLVVGTAYLLAAAPPRPWVTITASLALGPLAVYLAVQLLRLAHWAWMAVVILVALLLLSSLYRAVLTPDLPLAPLSEAAVELLILLYLARPHVRARFSGD